MRVYLSPAEKFLNWYTTTKLYLRKEKGKEEWQQERELFDQLCIFFDEIKSEEIKRMEENQQHLINRIKDLEEEVKSLSGLNNG